MENNNRYALVTGATSGIGYELARLLAKDGYNLIIVARNEQELGNKAAEFQQHGVHVIPIARDLFNRSEAQALFEDVKARGLAVDILINDAGQGLFGKFQDTDLERELAIIDLNIGSLVILTKLFLQQMLERGEGRILNLASIASKMPGPWQSIYHGTKAFVLSFTEAIRAEVKDTGITITALLPGATNTDFFNKAGMQDSKIVQDKSELSDPADVARDGYAALMAGEDKVVSGFKNKVQVAMSNVLPDESLASQGLKKQAPVDK